MADLKYLLFNKELWVDIWNNLPSDEASMLGEVQDRKIQIKRGQHSQKIPNLYTYRRYYSLEVRIYDMARFYITWWDKSSDEVEKLMFLTAFESPEKKFQVYKQPRARSSQSFRGYDKSEVEDILMLLRLGVLPR